MELRLQVTELQVRTPALYPQAGDWRVTLRPGQMNLGQADADEAARCRLERLGRDVGVGDLEREQARAGILEPLRQGVIPLVDLDLNRGVGVGLAAGGEDGA